MAPRECHQASNGQRAMACQRSLLALNQRERIKNPLGLADSFCADAIGRAYRNRADLLTAVLCCSQLRGAVGGVPARPAHGAGLIP